MADAVSLEGLEFEISATTRDAIQNLDNLSSSLKNLKSSVETNINSSIDKFKELNKAISAVSENNPIHKLAESLEKISGISKLSNIKVPELKISDIFSENITNISSAVNQLDTEKLGLFAEKIQVFGGLGNVGDSVNSLSQAITNFPADTLDEKVSKIQAVFGKPFGTSFIERLRELKATTADFPVATLSSIAYALGQIRDNYTISIPQSFLKELELLSRTAEKIPGIAVVNLEALSNALSTWKDTKSIGFPKGFNTALINFNDAIKKIDTTNLPALESLGKALQGLSGLKDIKLSSSIANQISKISDALKKLTEDDINKLRELADAVKKIGEVGDKSLKLKINTSDVDKAKKATSGMKYSLNNAFKDMGSGFKDVGLGIFKTITSIPKGIKQAFSGDVTSGLKNIFISPLQGIFQVTSGIFKLASSARALTPILTKAFTAPLKYAGKLSVAIGKSILSPIQKVASRLKVVIAGFGKIIKLRAFRFIITSITGGIKEGTDNLYQFSKGINGEFAKSMDTLATSMLYFKNSVGAAIAPIINQLAPAVDLLVDKIVEGTNKINQFLAQMTGATYWTKAVKYPKEYAEAVDDAKKSVQDFTMGFDELNIISDNSSSKSSDNLDYSKMFEIVDLQKNPWTEQLKNAIENGDWYGAGNLLGEKFNSVFQNIDYSGAGAELGTKINNAISLAKGFLDISDFETIGTGIASFLNSGFDKIDFYNLGSVLAGKWNILINTVHGFVTEFKFAEFGKDLSNTVNGWFDTIDLNKAVDDLSLGLQGILDLTSSFLENTNFSEFGNKVGGALNKLVDDLPTIVSKFASAAGDFASSVFDFLSGTIEGIDWKDSGEKLFDAIENLFTDVDWGKVTSSFSEFLGSAIGGAISLFTGFAGEASEAYSNLYDWLSSGNADSGEQFVQWGEENVVRPLLKGVVSGMYGSSAWNDFEDVINEKGGMLGFLEGWGADVIDGFFVSIDNIKTKVQEKAAYIIEGLKTGLLWKDIGSFLNEKIFLPFISALKDLFGIHSPSSVMAEQGAFLIAGLKNGITDTWKSLKEWVKQHIFDPFITGFKNLFGINSPSTVMQELGGYIISGLKSGITNGWSSIKDWTKSHVFNPFITAFKSLFGINSPSKVMKEQGEYITEGMKDGIEAPTDSLKESVGKAVDAVKSPLSSIGDFFRDTFSDAWQKVKGVFSDGGDVFVGFETGVSDIFKKLVNGLIDGINAIMHDAFNTINAGFWALRLWGFNGGYPFYYILPEINIPEIPKFAKGGFPNSGDLFFANENGKPEFVGSMGGRTAVANNDQIVEGIYSAVYSAMMAFSQSNSSSGTPELNIYLDSKQITAKVEERKLSRGQQIFTGGVVNEY